ncbi:MAG: IS91 family transposase [Pseudomonadota bacterium]
MVTLAEIVSEVGDEYRSQYATQLLPSHRQALTAIEQCRTPWLGGHVYYCESCDATHYQYHSCRNRHCPQCQFQAGEQWLQRQQARLLPTHYFMLTFTLPEQLRPIARANQRLMYNLLFRCAAQATQQLAQDRRHVGGQIGMVGVLHTWGRSLAYHPHVHFLVPGGGLDANSQWQATSHNFFVPVKALSKLFRAKFRYELRKTELFNAIPTSVWRCDWVVHSQPVGQGQHALKYLAPYIFRVALSNRRLVKFENHKVTFRYRQSDTGQWRSCRLDAFEFLRRFLQHVLPKGFVKVRYYGLFAPAKRAQLAHCQQLLSITTEPNSVSNNEGDSKPTYQPLCAICQQPMQLIYTLRRRSRCPP